MSVELQVLRPETAFCFSVQQVAGINEPSVIKLYDNCPWRYFYL